MIAGLTDLFSDLGHGAALHLPHTLCDLYLHIPLIYTVAEDDLLHFINKLFFQERSPGKIKGDRNQLHTSALPLF